MPMQGRDARTRTSRMSILDPVANVLDAVRCRIELGRKRDGRIYNELRYGTAKAGSHYPAAA